MITMYSLQNIINIYLPIRENIFKYLRPSEISDLCVATGLYLSNFEKNKYMFPINEIFINTDYIKGSDNNYIAIIGNDVKGILNSSKNTKVNILSYKEMSENSHINYTELTSLYTKNNIYDNVGKVFTGTTKISNIYKGDRIEAHLSMACNVGLYTNAHIGYKYLGHEMDNIIKLWKQDYYNEGEYRCNLECYTLYNNKREFHNIQMVLRHHKDTEVADTVYVALKIADISPLTHITSQLKNDFLEAFMP